MTAATFYLSMRINQAVSGFAMIKMICIETDHLEGKAMMIAVAFHTLLSLYLAGSMISPVFRDSDPDLQVTIQAFLIGYFFSQDMAFCAI
jgi:hypothetical protein